MGQVICSVEGVQVCHGSTEVLYVLHVVLRRAPRRSVVEAWIMPGYGTHEARIGVSLDILHTCCTK